MSRAASFGKCSFNVRQYRDDSVMRAPVTQRGLNAAVKYAKRMTKKTGEDHFVEMHCRDGSLTLMRCDGHGPEKGRCRDFAQHKSRSQRPLAR